MHHSKYGTELSTDFDSVKLIVASSADILDWSHGEVTKPETINYRTQKPERDGLFCEKIFGPVKDINPHDAKFKGMRSREAAVDKKGELVTKSIVRRERMAHIALAAPVSHIWFLRGAPSATGMLLGMTVKSLEKVIYFASYVVTSADTEKRDQMIADIAAEAEAAKVAIKARFEKLAEDEGSSAKALAAQMTEELEKTAADYADKKGQLELLDAGKLITEGEYRRLPDDFADLAEVGMGAKAIKKLLDAINLDELIIELAEESDKSKGQKKKKLMKRLKVLEGMQRAKIKPSSTILTVVPVIPPDLRPMVQLAGGRFATSDLNDLYRRVINRNNRLKKLVDLKAPEVIQRNEQRMLQEAVDALIDNNNARSGRAVSATGGRRRLKSLSDMLKGKQGRFRQNLLGKRVDYSGRSVIVSGPELRMHQCGLPKMMALELFKPHVIGKLIARDMAHNIKAASRMIEQGESIIWDMLDEAIEGKYVLLNRAPTLHRLGIQAFQPVLIEGKAIQLHPLVAKGFNADFDGDQMAVHLPLSAASQKEAREIMSASKNLLKPADGTPILHIEQDIVLGCYYLTYDRLSEAGKQVRGYASVAEGQEALAAGVINLQTPINIRFRGSVVKTTLGRALFNEIFPEDFVYQDQTMTKKSLGKVMAKIYEQYGVDATAEIADKLKDIGFEYATASGLSTGMDDYTDLKGLDKIVEKGDVKSAEISDQFDNGFITDDERYRLTVDAWRDVSKEVLVSLEEQFKEEETSTSIAVLSGARGNISQVNQISGLYGIVVDASGREIELPIKSNYKTGFSPLEYFTSTRGARKGMISTALKTADSGYLTRRLVDVSQDIFTSAEEYDDPGFEITKKDTQEIGLKFSERITGRSAAVAIKIDGKTIVKKGALIAEEAGEQIEENLESVKIMSVLSCTNLRGVSRQSYGTDMATGELVAGHQPIGVIAAQSIGEPGTQLTLDVFHSGGVAGEDISQGLPRVEELFEARKPKGEAVISSVTGVVSMWDNGVAKVVQVVPTDTKATIQKLDGRKAKIKSGTTVQQGDVIATGEKDAKPLVAKVEGVADVFKDEIVISSGTGGVVRYEVPKHRNILVKDGDSIKAAERITAGSINLQDLMALKGIEATQRYIMSEILRIFAGQGQTISDKHLEVIVRQMFSRVQVEDPGDSPFVTGDIVSKAAVVESNDKLADSKKEPAQFTQLLLGITKVSTWSDSFLSAASFQDTTRVLINAAISGKEDRLYGLKENVIIGRKIPVGTGMLPEEDLELETEDIEGVLSEVA